MLLGFQEVPFAVISDFFLLVTLNFFFFERKSRFTWKMDFDVRDYNVIHSCIGPIQCRTSKLFCTL